jgi:hypothetical protein
VVIELGGSTTALPLLETEERERERKSSVLCLSRLRSHGLITSLFMAVQMFK